VVYDPYWEIGDLQNRISEETVLQILDDDHDGSADEAAISRLQSDSTAYVDGFLRPCYDLDAVHAAPPSEVVRLALDVAEWMCAKRWPRYLGGDWEKKRDHTRGELLDLRTGKTRLDVVGTPEPAANEGGVVLTVDAGDEEEHVRLWGFSDTGDF
jgi:phage gp36-like protein